MTDFPAGTPSDGLASSIGASAENRAGRARISTSFDLLQRLAATLDLPVGTFLDPPAGSGIVAPKILLETSNLLAAFSRISCPTARRRCIDLVEAAGRPEDAP